MMPKSVKRFSDNIMPKDKGSFQCIS
jgi:hypothetical protein